MSPGSSKISALEFLAPLIVGCALFMEKLDSTVIATALPAIAKSLDEDPIRLNLAITSYLLSLAVFIPISGWMADRFGARTVFRAAIVDLHARLDPVRLLAIAAAIGRRPHCCRAWAAR